VAASVVRLPLEFDRIRSNVVRQAFTAQKPEIGRDMRTTNVRICFALVVVLIGIRLCAQSSERPAYLNTSLQEIARVGQYAIIYLPVHGLYIQLRLKSSFRGIDLPIVFNIFNYFKKPSGIKPCYMGNQHFWEIGMRGYRVKDMVTRMSQFFDVISVYRNKDWLPSQNFILRSKFIKK